MKAKIQAILERELAKLDAISLGNIEPLPAREIKSLDTLIRAYRAFVEPSPTPPSPGSVAPVTESGPASQSTDDLLNAITEPAT